MINNNLEQGITNTLLDINVNIITSSTLSFLKNTLFLSPFVKLLIPILNLVSVHKKGYWHLNIKK